MIICFNDQLCGSLRSAIWILAAEGILFTVSPDPFHIIITFVACYDDGMAWMRNHSECLENMGRSHGICLKGLNRILVRNRNDGLGRQVKNKIGLYLRKYLFHPGTITDIRKMMLRSFCQVQLLK